MGTAATATTSRAAAARYGRWIYASAVLALAGASGLSGALGASPVVAVAGAAFLGLGIVGATFGAVRISVAARSSTAGRGSGGSGR